MNNYSEVRVLLAEDDPIVLRRLISNLHKIGFTNVQFVKSFADGARLLSKFIPSICILDIELNDSDIGGIEIAQLLYKIDKKAPIIFLTSYVGDEKRIKKAVELRNQTRIILSKQAPENQLYSNLKLLVDRKIFASEDRFTFSCDGIYKTVFFSELMYARSGNKKTYLRVEGLRDELPYNVTLSQFEKKGLPDYFIRVHSSYIINSKKAFDMDKLNQVLLFGSHEVSYSKTYIEVIEKIMNIRKTRK